MTMHLDPIDRASALALVLAASLTAPALAASGLEDARAAWRDGEPRTGVILLKNLLQDDPDAAEARQLLARIYLDLGDPAAAEQEMRRARAAGLADTEALPVLAEALLAQGRHNELLETIEPPTDAAGPVRAELSALRADAQLAQGELEAAAASLTDALDADPDNLRAAIGQARLTGLQGDLQSAQQRMQELASAHPGSALAWEALGSLRFAAQEYAEAAEAFGKAFEHGQGAWSFRFRRGLARIEAGDLEGAREDAEAVAAIAPGYAGLAYLNGRISLLAAEPEDAIRQLEQYLGAAPDDPRAIYYMALALYQEGRYGQAEEYLERLRKRFRDSAMTATLLGLTRLQLDDAAGAEAVVAPFARQADATPATIDVWRRALMAQGQQEAATEQLQRLVERAPDASGPRLMLARRQQEAGDQALALANIRDVLEREPENLQARVLLIRGLILSGEDHAAVTEAARLLETAPESPMAHTVQAAVLTRQQNFERARAAFRRALELDPTFTRAALGLAALEAGSERPEAARQALDELLAADPGNTGALLASAGLARREGGTDAYIERLEKGLADNPQDIALRSLLAQAYLQSGKSDDALRLLAEVPSAQAEQPQLLLLRAQAEMAAGRGDSAVTTLRRVTELSPESAQPQFLLAVAHARLDDLNAAERHLHEGLRLDDAHRLQSAQLAAILGAAPDDGARGALLERLLRAHPGHPQVAATYARFAAQQRRFGVASEIFAGLLRSHPDSEDYLIGLAQAQAASGSDEEARASINAWLREHPQSVGARLLLAQLALAQQDWDLAIEQYRQILETNPNQPVALNNLAMLLADSQPREALRLAERALALRPADPAYLDTVGLLLLELGETDRARAMLAKAHRASTDPSIAFRYAKALAASGAEDQARQLLLQNATANYPEKAQAQDLLRDLSQ